MNRSARQFLLQMICVGLFMSLVVSVSTLEAMRQRWEADTKDIEFATQHAPVPRSGKWPKVEKEHLEKHPLCAVCEEEANIKWREVHHILDFHDHPELELDPDNLITLCGVGGGCKAHFWLGHTGNFRLPSNPHIREDAALMNKRWKAARKLNKEQSLNSKGMQDVDSTKVLNGGDSRGSHGLRVRCQGSSAVSGRTDRTDRTRSLRLGCRSSIQAA